MTKNRAKGLGSLEHVILLAILGLDETSAYGAMIYKAVAGSGRRTTVSAIHTTLDSLEEKGFVTSRLGEPNPGRGGRAKKLFRVSPNGRGALQGAERSLRALRGLVPDLI